MRQHCKRPMKMSPIVSCIASSSFMALTPAPARAKLTWTASNPNGTVRIPFPRKLQLTGPNPSSQRATRRSPQQIRDPLPIGNVDRQTRTLAPLVGGVTGMTLMHPERETMRWASEMPEAAVGPG
jgi:hypothetical protein